MFATARRLESLSDLLQLGCTCLAMDVTDDSSVRSAVDSVLARTGRVDVLVNNAGVGQVGPLAEVPLERVRAVYETNVLGMLRVVQAVVPAMVSARSGCVVNIASIVGLVGSPWAGAYSSSKAAVINASDVLRLELAPFNVRVVCVCPGAVRSHFGTNSTQTVDTSSLRIYAAFKALIFARAQASQSARSTPTDVFARRVVTEVLSQKPPALLLSGHLSRTARILLWMPRAVRDWVLARTFGLNLRV